ncbi:MAG: ATP-binding protein [Alphaproteobacteria bacterium]
MLKRKHTIFFSSVFFISDAAYAAVSPSAQHYTSMFRVLFGSISLLFIALCIKKIAAHRQENKTEYFRTKLEVVEKLALHRSDCLFIAHMPVKKTGEDFSETEQARIVYINDTMKARTGWVDSTYPPIQSLFDNQDLQEDLQHLNHSLQHQQEARFDTKLHFAEGNTAWVEVDIMPIIDERGEGHFFIFWLRDISVRKNLQECLLKAKEDALAAEQAKSVFLTTMTHELRTPLNAIIGFSDIISNQMFGEIGNNRYRDYAEDIHHSGLKLLGLINDILDLSKAGAGRLALRETLVSINDVLEHKTRQYWPSARTTGVNLYCEASDDLPLLFADDMHIRQIVTNLLSNALKFTPEGGSVTCRAYLNDALAMVLEIEDTGKGIAPEHLEKIGTPFYQGVDNPGIAHPGSGLGLALSMEMMKLHNGTFDIHSVVGKGTLVRMIFPPQRTALAANAQYLTFGQSERIEG